MSTLSWLTVGLVVVVILLLLAIVVVLTLFREPTGKREGSKKNARNTSNTPLTTSNTITRTRVWTFVDTHWEKIYGTPAALLTVVLTIWTIKWMFPNWTDTYFGHGGWGYDLLYPVTILLLPAVVWKGWTRKILLTILAAVLVTASLYPALLATRDMAFGPPSAPVQTAHTQTVRQAPRDPCDGNYRPLVIGPSPVLATPGGRNCMIDFDVREGGVILIGQNGEEFGRPVTKDKPAGKSNFRVIEWKSDGPSARLNVRYYR